MAERRRKGLLRFNGDEKFVRDHKCAHVSYIDDYGDDDDEYQGDPRISLHAVAGVPVSDTVRLKVRVHGHDLVALVDSGASHNFLQEGVAARLGFRRQPVPEGMRVAQLNGDGLACSGVCRGTEVLVATEPFQVDCYVLALGDDDLILGVQWLRTLGPILWDFTDLTMSCTVHGRSVTWRGEPRPPANRQFIPMRPLPRGRDNSRARRISISIYSLGFAISIIMNIILLYLLLSSSQSPQPCK